MLGTMDTVTALGLGIALLAALSAVVGNVYAARENRRQAQSQAEDRAQFYGRLTAVVEGLAEGQKRHDREIEAIKAIQGRHGNAIAVIDSRLRAIDTGVPGVSVNN